MLIINSFQSILEHSGYACLFLLPASHRGSRLRKATGGAHNMWGNMVSVTVARTRVTRFPTDGIAFSTPKKDHFYSESMPKKILRSDWWHDRHPRRSLHRLPCYASIIMHSNMTHHSQKAIYPVPSALPSGVSYPLEATAKKSYSFCTSFRRFVPTWSRSNNCTSIRRFVPTWSHSNNICIPNYWSEN